MADVRNVPRAAVNAHSNRPARMLESGPTTDNGPAMVSKPEDRERVRTIVRVRAIKAVRLEMTCSTRGRTPDGELDFRVCGCRSRYWLPIQASKTRFVVLPP